MRIPFLILLALWILGVSFWCKGNYCPTKTKQDANTVAPVSSKGCDNSLSFTDGTFKLRTTDNFYFGANNSQLKNTSAMHGVLTKVAAYLKENSNKTIQFDGLYFSKEVNNSTEENLGLARSASIKNYLVQEYGVNADQLILGSQLTEKACYDQKNKVIRKGATATFGITN